MSIKDNFSQAVKELWKKDGQDAKPQNAGQEGSMTELDRYLRDEQQPAQNVVLTDQDGDIPLETPYYRTTTPEQQAANAAPAQGGEQAAASAGAAVSPEQQAPAAAQTAQPVNAAPVQPEQPRVNPASQNVPDEQQGGMNQNLRNIAGNYGQNNQNAYNNGAYNPGAYNQGYNAPGNYGGGYGGYIPPAAGGAPIQAANESDEVTVISKNTVIDGNVRSLANMQIDGNIKGNVETTRNIDMSGKIIGDITCNNAGMNSAAMQGNMSLKGRLRMDRDTILIGDLSSQYADINGRVRGKLDIVGKAELKRDAIVFGDINASTIAVTDGAIIQGYVNTTFLSKEDSRNVFPDAISLDNKESQAKPE